MFGENQFYLYTKKLIIKKENSEQFVEDKRSYKLIEAFMDFVYIVGFYGNILYPIFLIGCWRFVIMTRDLDILVKLIGKNQ